MTNTQPIPTTPARRRRWPWVVASVGVLAAAGYVALAASLGAKTPSDTLVQGVQIGGKTHDAAVAALRAGLGDRAAAKVPVAFGDTRVNLDPAAAGLAIDYPGSIDGLTGFTLNPVAVYDRLTGAVEQDAARLVDQSALSAAVTEAAAKAKTEPKDARLAFTDGKAVVTDGVEGAEVDVPGTVEAISKGWLVVPSVNGAMKRLEPEITTAEAQAAKSEIADPMVAGPVTIKVGEKDFPLSPTVLAAVTTFAPKDGTLSAVHDEKRLVSAVRRAGLKAEVLTEGRDAVVTSSDGKFSVKPSVDGLDVDAEKVPAAITAALASPERVATIPAKASPAKFTTAEAKKSLPTGVISTFTTHFPNSPDRTHNIILAARALDGTYVAPGETFSMNAHLGQRTPEKGYRGAPVIYNGRLTTDYGGGISQVSTTLFNAIFFSGAQIDEFHPHSFYISRYPEGREATISWPDVDNRFTNTTDGGILITTDVGPDSITVTFQGKKTWDIEATKGPRVNIVKPGRIVDDKKGCVSQSPQDGFQVTVGRVFKKAGKVVDTTYFTTHYIPEDLVICTNP